MNRLASQVQLPQWQQSLGQMLEVCAAIGLLLAFAFATLSGGATYWWALFGLRVLFLVSAVCWLASGVFLGRLLLPRFSVVLAVSAYALWTLICTWTSQYQFASLEGLADTAMYLGALLIAAGVLTTHSRRRWWFAVFMVVAVLHGVYALAQTQGLRFTPQFENLIASTYYNPNQYAAFLDLAIPLFCALVLFTIHKSIRMIAVILALLMFSNRLISDSWGGLLSVGFALFFLFTYYISTKKGIGFALNAFVLVIFAVTSVTIITYQYIRINQPAKMQKIVQGIQLNLGLRYNIYKSNFGLIAKYPVFGVGPSNYVRAFPEFRAPRADGSGNATHRQVEHAHNDLMHIAVETGLLGAFLYLSVLVTSLWRSNAIPIFFALVALIGHGLGDSNFSFIQGNAFMGFVLLGMLASKDSIGDRSV